MKIVFVANQVISCRCFVSYQTQFEYRWWKTIYDYGYYFLCLFVLIKYFFFSELGVGEGVLKHKKMLIYLQGVSRAAIERMHIRSDILPHSKHWRRAHLKIWRKIHHRMLYIKYIKYPYIRQALFECVNKRVRTLWDDFDVSSGEG